MKDSAQKARFYDLIIDRAKKELDGCDSPTCDTASLIFRLIPELNIDECERMRSEFEKTLTNICVGWKGKKPDWRHYIKDSANILLKIANDISNLIQDAPFEEKPTEGEQKPNQFDEGYKVGFTAAKFNQWKPTDEQMNELRVAKDSCFDLSFKTKNALKLLYNDLKKLREEQVVTDKFKPLYTIGDYIIPLNDELCEVIGICRPFPDRAIYSLRRMSDICGAVFEVDAHTIDSTATRVQRV